MSSACNPPSGDKNGVSVIIVTPGIFPIPSFSTGSVETSVMNISAHMARDIQVTVLGRRHPGVPEDGELDGVRYVNVEASNYTEYAEQVIRFLHYHPSTFIQVENAPYLVQPIKHRLPQSRIWLSLHSTRHFHNQPAKRKAMIRIFNDVERIVVNSEFMKRYVVQYGHQPGHKVLVNYLGVNTDHFRPPSKAEQEALRPLIREYSGCDPEKVILYCGRLIRIKGVHRLLQSLQYIRPHFDDFVLFVVGGAGYAKNRQTHYVRTLYALGQPYGWRVRFIPYVPQNEIPLWYRLADVVVVPSIGPEAFGLVNLEAMATGVPVVATRIGGIPEVISHKQQGLLVPLNDHRLRIAESLYHIVTDEQLAQSLGKEGRKKAACQFTWQQSAKRLGDDYKRYG